MQEASHKKKNLNFWFRSTTLGNGNLWQGVPQCFHVPCGFCCRLRKNLKTLIVVHPTWFIKALMALFRPFLRWGCPFRWLSRAWGGAVWWLVFGPDPSGSKTGGAGVQRTAGVWKASLVLQGPCEVSHEWPGRRFHGSQAGAFARWLVRGVPVEKEEPAPPCARGGQLWVQPCAVPCRAVPCGPRF